MQRNTFSMKEYKKKCIYLILVKIQFHWPFIFTVNSLPVLCGNFKQKIEEKTSI